MAKNFYQDCMDCGKTMPIANYIRVSSDLFSDGVIPICDDCLAKRIEKEDGNFDYIDRLCQWMGIPFDIKNWLEIYQKMGYEAMSAYARKNFAKEYPGADWKTTYLKYKQLEEQKLLDDEVPALKEAEFQKLREKWGEQYLDEDIAYLEDLFQGILQTQNIVGKLQMDDAIKLCKISALINEKIRAGEDFDKLLKSYDTLRKSADFTSKNIKNACDFDSVGELFAYCEKKGWMNKFYDGVAQDTIDLTMKDIQNWIRNLYKNETGIAEDVERRVQALQIADSMEESFTKISDDGLDEFDQESQTAFEEFDEEAGLK